MIREASSSRPVSGSFVGPAREPRWATALVESCAALATRPSLEFRNRLRCAAWPILRTALARLVRDHASRLGPLSPEAIDDVAAEKALDLLLRCESGAWSPGGWTGERLAAFLSRVARNGAIDHLREFGPRRLISTLDDELIFDPSSPATELESQPARAAEAAEYAGHLLKGVHALKPRARTVWFLRVCFDWRSRRIAAYPGVDMPPSHVDVELQRTRGRLRAWMESAGFDIREMPPGTFAALWNECVRQGAIPPILESAEDA